MKRGRPSMRMLMHKMIIEVMSENQIPLTISSISRLISEKLGREVSWNTVEKYLQELLNLDKIQPIVLPHSKKEGVDGLIVYTLKK